MIWIVAAAALAAVLIILWVAKRQMSRSLDGQIRQSLAAAQQELLGLVTQRLEVERAQSRGDLEVGKQAVESSAQRVEQQLARFERLIREYEQDRSAKFGSLERQLTQTAAETQRLQHTTTQLTAMLGNSRVRGQWGERTAEDIFRLCGLEEGIHYRKQVTSAAGRPDITILLPGDQRLYLDIKFPLDNFMRWVNAAAETERDATREQFLRDVKEHVKALSKREYAGASTAAPDYVIMFIPNEQVFGAINERLPGLIDEALKQRIILCGPWTLYATVRVIWQAWQNYYHAQTIDEIAKTVQEFLNTYGLFKKRFADLGAKLDQATKTYEEIVQKSYAQLDRKIDKIEGYRRGQPAESLTGPSEQPEALTTEALPHD